MNGWDEASGGGPRQLRLFERLSVLIDLHLISSMCSAGGNASYVATAGKTGLGRRARRGAGRGGGGGDQGRGEGSLCWTLMGRNPGLQLQCSGEEGLLSVVGALQGTGSAL